MIGTSSANEDAGINGTSSLASWTGTCSGAKGAGAGGDGAEVIGTSSGSRGAGAGQLPEAGASTGMLLAVIES